MSLSYLSVCSGIEAATVAWHPLGWAPVAFAEIERFPSAVLAHHYPTVPNLGDMCLIAARVMRGEIEAPDVLVGGTPCQAFSVAGNRESLNDDRGNLTLRFAELVDAIDAARLRDGKPACIVAWENVPGVLSTHDNAFGCFLARLAGEDDELQPAGRRWSNAGCVYGPRRTVAWRIVDAQYFGLAQRRRRVLVVASARAGLDPAEVLFEWQGLRRDTPPRRGERKDLAAAVTGSLAKNGGIPAGNDCEPRNLIAYAPAVAGAMVARSSRGGGQTNSPGNNCDTQLVAYGGNNTVGPIDVATARNACASASASGRMDFESETFVIAGTLQASGKAAGSATQQDAESGLLVAAPPRAQPNASMRADSDTYIAVHGTQDPCVGDIAFALGRNTGQENAIAISGRARGDDGRGYARPEHISDIAGALDTVKPDRVAAPGQGVRRLTPRECERLQGFPTVTEKLRIDVCIDRQSGRVGAALSCHRWQNNASGADGCGWLPPADAAARSFSMPPAAPAPLAALHALIGYAPTAHALLSHGRLIWSASGAAQSAASRPPTDPATIAPAVASIVPALVRTITDGRAASPASIRLSFPVRNGNKPATPFGDVTAGSADDAASDPGAGTFTTSDLGRLIPASATTTEILCCSVLAAIAGCIPSEILPELFSLEISVEAPYTLIPDRKGLAADGPRYKALGNSMAVPCMRWLGRRIELVAAGRERSAA